MSLKYFGIIGIIIVILTTLVVSIYLAGFVINSTVTSTIEKEHNKVAQYYNNQVWCNFSHIFDQLQNSDIPTWQNNSDYEKFAKISTTLLSSAGLSKITLYTDKGNEFFTTYQGDVVYFDNEYSQNGSLFIPSMGLYNPDGSITKGSYIRSRTPISDKDCPNRNPDSNRIILIEMFSDITPATHFLTWMKIYIVAGITLIFILFYIALHLTSQKTERIINKQHEEKLRLEQAKSQAESRNQEKSMFLANVSHELRTPLNAIIGFSAIIKDEIMGPVGHQQYREYINDIHTSGVHLLSLINDILDYSKAEAHKLEVEVVDVDITKIAHSCLRLIETRANEAKVSLIENVPDKHIILKADPKRMKQIVLNLLSNAVKFTTEGGKVTLTIKDDLLEETTQLTVSDTGIGIAPKDLSKAMAPFGQIDSSLSRRYEGTGLGLPLTKKLTNIMGGKFDIKSEVGVGTVVTLSFPLKNTLNDDKNKKDF